MDNTHKYGYCCPGCGKVLKEEDSLYNVGPLIFPSFPDGTIYPVYITREILTSWVEKCDNSGHRHKLWIPETENILELFANEDNVHIWEKVPSIADLNDGLTHFECKDDIVKSYYYEFMDKFLKRDNPEQAYKFQITLNTRYGYGYKKFLDNKLSPSSAFSPNVVKPNARHCPHCRAAVLEGAFEFEQKLVGFFGNPAVGKTCLLLALAAEMLSQDGILLKFTREKELKTKVESGISSGKVFNLEDYKGDLSQQQALDIMRVLLEKQYQGDDEDEYDSDNNKKQIELTYEHVLLQMYKQGYMVDKTDVTAINMFDISIRVANDDLGLAETIFSFVDIAGEIFGGNAVRGLDDNQMGEMFPMFKNCDVFIFCVDRKRAVNQAELLGNMRQSIEQFFNYIQNNSEKTNNRQCVMCLATKYDECMEELSDDAPKPAENKNIGQFGYIKDTFGFLHEYTTISDRLNCKSIIQTLSKYAKVTPLYCSAYGDKPKNYKKMREHMKEWTGASENTFPSLPPPSVTPINIDLILKWIYFVLGKSEYREGIKRSDDNPVSQTELEAYRFTDPTIMSCSDPENLMKTDLAVLGELFCNLNQNERRRYNELLWEEREHEYYKPKIEEINNDLIKYKDGKQKQVTNIENEHKKRTENANNEKIKLENQFTEDKQNCISIHDKIILKYENEMNLLIQSVEYERDQYIISSCAEQENFDDETEIKISQLKEEQEREKEKWIYDREKEMKNEIENTPKLALVFEHTKIKKEHERKVYSYESNWQLESEQAVNKLTADRALEKQNKEAENLLRQSEFEEQIALLGTQKKEKIKLLEEVRKKATDALLDEYEKELLKMDEKLEIFVRERDARLRVLEHEYSAASLRCQNEREKLEEQLNGEKLQWGL